MGDAEQQPVTARVVSSLSDIDAADWDACAGSANPFVRHAFLSALEDSGSATLETGWAPHHVAVEDVDGKLLGVTPMYLKNHSYGEYVFDHAWAHAYERAGGHYYPKLQISVPFTPVTGPRLLVNEAQDGGAPARDVRRALLAGCIQIAEKLEVSSLHVTFPTKDEWDVMGEMGLLLRTGEQFHWQNRDYTDFDGFLADLASRKRKAIRKERKAALADGDIVIQTLAGRDITESHWDIFFRFYLDTGSRKWGSPYLNREFFSLIGERMPDDIVLMLALRDGQTIAGALNLVGGDTIYGRYWGCLEDHRFLHFELCYYRAIDYAIARGLKAVEAGAQGPHKLARGYVPVHTYSAHWARDPGFHRALAHYLDQERREVDAEIDYLGDRTPFRKEPNA